MAEYIDLEIAKRCFQNIDAGRVGGSTLLTPTEFAEYLDDIEHADVAPVRHARWIPLPNKSKYKNMCGNCREGSDLQTDFCPHCGAIMDGGG